MSRLRFLSIFSATLPLFLAGCNSGSIQHQTAHDSAQGAGDKTLSETRVLYGFEKSTLSSDINIVGGNAARIAQDASQGKQALRLQWDSSKQSYTGITFRPDQPWNWSNLEDFSLALDIANRGQVSTQLFLDIQDKDGSNYTRTVSIPVGDSSTYYAKLNGHDLSSPDGDSSIELNFASGLRSNPPTWEGGGTQFISMWGKKNLNLEGIVQISLSVQSVLRDKEITIDNVRLIPNSAKDPKFLTGIVDRYGQNAKQDFLGKIYSDKELLAQRDAELKSLNNGKPLADRSRFGGWKQGPQREATGYFRTEKIDGKWWLIDPEGYLYFATGIDIIRLANSTTMTGFDFNQELINQRTSDDVTPEDSAGLNTVDVKAVPSRTVVSEVRADMFNWLPSYDDDLGNHYGYRRSAHSGPLKRGETYSFYSANLERKYGETSSRSYLDNWEKVTIDRMLNWGFTSLGNWTDPRFYDQQRIPFFADGWIIGDFKTVSSGNDFWSPLPDVFDPVFEKRAMITAKTVAHEVKGSPWCVGVFIDNEKSFGRAETNESRLGIVLHTLRRDGESVPTKRAFTDLMRKKYKNIKALNSAWNKKISDWQEFDDGIDSDITTDAQLADYSLMLAAYADKYFEVVKKSLKAHMPNHLYLGARFPDWGMPIEVVKASAEHVDVVSYNSYKEGLPNYKWDFLSEIDKPSIIGEFHIGASDSGLFHPGLVHASSQEDRGRMFKEYMQSVIDNPYFVGAHWFQYIDSPITGRAYDGENYNVGFVSVADVPYAPMVESAKSLHREMYQRRRNNN